MSTVLITVVGPNGRRDLSLPADAPVYRLLPSLVELVGELEAYGDGNGNGEVLGWRLIGPAGGSLEPGSSLADGGVLDGALLYLERPPAAAEPSAPALALSDDALTPEERTAAALPTRVSLWQRIAGALRAVFGRGTPARPSADEAEPVLPPAAPDEAVPSPNELAIPRADSVTRRLKQSWRGTDYLEALDEAITKPRLARCVTIAVVSPKGGVGKTTTTALVGSLFALLRRDRVVAVDTNPDFGSLGRSLAPNQRLFVDDLLEDLDQPGLTTTALDAMLARSAHGLMVLPAPTDPSRMEKLDEIAYTRVIERLKEYVGIVLLDCGTGLQEPSARAALRCCDQIVLVTDAEPAAASLVTEAARLLVRSGRPLTLAVNKMPRRNARLDLDALGSHIPEARALVVLPEEHEAAGRVAAGEFDWRDAPESWQRACRELAVTLVSDWRRLELEL